MASFRNSLIWTCRYQKNAILTKFLSERCFLFRKFVIFVSKMSVFLLKLKAFDRNSVLKKLSSIKYPFLFSVLEALKSQILFFEFLIILNCSDCIYSTLSKNGAIERHHFYSILLHLFTPLWWWGILLVESIRRIQMLNLWKTLNSSSTDIFQFNLWFFGLLNII